MRTLVPYGSNSTRSPRRVRSFDRVFDDMLQEFQLAPWHTSFFERGLRGFSPRLDVSEDDKAYTISVELPGIDQKDIELTLENGVLTIAGEKKSVKEENVEGRTYSERSYGSFQRCLNLGDDVELEQVNAAYKDGILTITAPKREEVVQRQTARKIEVQ